MTAILLLSGCGSSGRPSLEPLDDRGSRAADADAAKGVESTPPEGTAPEFVAASSPTNLAPEASPATGRIVVLSPSLRVDVDHSVVEADGTLCLDAGYLEQVACRRGTREHESLIVPDAMPSAIHAAMLLAGFTPGRPGRWQWSDTGELSVEPPTGDQVEILLRIDGEPPRPIRDFIEDGRTREPFPEGAFVFSGSQVRENPPSLGPGTHYLADWSGSAVGIVTFGDEMVSWREVIPDSADAAAPVWITRSSQLPPPGTRATLILRRPSAGSDR